jgi:hypothetical protein
MTATEPKRGGWRYAVAAALLVSAWAGVHAYLEQRHRILPLDLDGWGHLVEKQQAEGRSLGTVFGPPSLWKGPVVPFVYGLVYYLVPVTYAVLGFNALALGVAALAYCRGAITLGSPPWAAALAVVIAWVAYLPHWQMHGYYFAEPLIALIAGCLFWLAAGIVRDPRTGHPFLAGLAAGLLLLARPPFIAVVGGLGLWFLGRRYRWRVTLLYGVGLLLVYLPWPVRNLVVERTVLPFTTEGGKILFQGTWLPGDDQVMNALRAMPEFQRIERTEEGLTPIEQYRHWQALARENIRQNPGGQLVLCVRKAMRFWVYMPAGSWVPAWKTGVFAAVFLGLAAVTLWRSWRSPLVRLAALFVGGLWLVHTVLHAELRYHMPVLPLLCLLAVLAFCPRPPAEQPSDRGTA